MEEAVKVLTAKFRVKEDLLNQFGELSEDASSLLVVFGAYVLDSDRKLEEQKTSENNLRRQRLNAEHQLGQLEKQLIASNAKQSKCEKQLLDLNLKLKQVEENLKESSDKLKEVQDENNILSAENETLKQKYSYLENEKLDFAEVIEKKNIEVDRLNEEWNEMAKKVAEANKLKHEAQYKLDEIKNSDVRRDFKEKRLQQENTMLERQIKEITDELDMKTNLVNSLKKDTTSKLLETEAKYETSKQEVIQLTNNLETYKKTCETQQTKINQLMEKVKRLGEEYAETESNIQQELSSQTKLVQLYKEDRDHAKDRLNEISSAFTELQSQLKSKSEEIHALNAQNQSLEEESNKTIDSLRFEIKNLKTELENANDLITISKQKGHVPVQPEELSSLSPMAAATSAILKKGMTLTQIYTEYVKVSDELLAERDENTKLKLYMEQILKEVEEKAPLLMRQKEDYEHARKTINSLSSKLEENILECQHLKNTHVEFERKIDFYKREEKRLKNQCVDLSEQVRVLLKEVEEARGGVVSSSETLPNVSASDMDLNRSSSGQVISEHLVTFKNIEELQEQNQRLLATVRELSEEQEKLEEEGGHEMIKDLKKKIENAKTDLVTLKEHQKTQEEMMQQLARQRDMYKVLCQSGGVMVGDVSSTSASNTLNPDIDIELTKTKAELDKTMTEYSKFKVDTSDKHKELNEKISKQEDDISNLKLEKERLKSQCEFMEEKIAVQDTNAETLKKEIKALESKCQSITNACSKLRVEAEQYKQEYDVTKEKYITLEVSVKTIETEKNLIKDAEKRLMQENQALLDQQHSQNVLLTNLQSIQNNLERQEFETRKSLGKQVETLQREMKALRRQSENENVQMKISAAGLEKECKELKIKLGVEMEKGKKLVFDNEEYKNKCQQLESKCKELEDVSKATETRLSKLLEEDNTAKVTEDLMHEIERHKLKIREMELVVSNSISEKKALSDQIEVLRKHIEQYKEIGDTNEQAINDLTKAKEDQAKDYEKKLSECNTSIQNYKKQLASALVVKNQIKNSADEAEKRYQATIAELRQANAPLEKRLQEVTKALVQAKKLEETATKDAQEKIEIAREAQDKYERELLLHAKDVEALTAVKDELNRLKGKSDQAEEEANEMQLKLATNDQVIAKLKEQYQNEMRKGEIVRKDLIDQNAILHGQVEKLSAQLAAAKAVNRSDDEKEASNDKSVEDVYELLRFVRREKEIADTKAEACEAESLRYRQRAEHLQRDLDETKEALELELKRTQGRMLSEEEHEEVLEKMKKLKEVESLYAAVQIQKDELINANKSLQEKFSKLEDELKKSEESKKQLESEKNSWLAEKTALKGEIERWTNRTNQLMSQSTKFDNEEIKRLQALKTQNEKVINALQDENKRTKQQFEVLKRESLKLRSEKTELQSKISSMQLNESQQQTSSTNDETNTNLQKELDESKKSLTSKTQELAEKNKVIQQLKKVAKKYKMQADKQQKILSDHNLSIGDNASEASVSTATTSAENISAESKQDYENRLKQKTDEIEKLNNQVSQLQNDIQSKDADSEKVNAKLSELEKALEEKETNIADMTSNISDMTMNIEKLKSDGAESKKKLEEQQEKNKKLLKTAKDKIQSLTRTKDSNHREKEELKKTVEDLRSKLQLSTLTSENSSNLSSENEQLRQKISDLEKHIDELNKEKENLNEKVNELTSNFNEMQEEKKKLEKLVKQQRQRLRSTGKSSRQSETTSQSEIHVATVRPTATSTQQKFHPQVTPTASIRPLAHAAPTAMISPSVPATTTSAPVASITAIPVATPIIEQASNSASVVPLSSSSSVSDPMSQQPSSSGRVNRNTNLTLPDRSASAFKAPVARAIVQAVERGESSASSENQQSGAGGSSSGNKRAYQDVQEPEDDIFLDEELDNDEPGTKKQRVEPVPTLQSDEPEEEQFDADAQDAVLDEEDEGIFNEAPSQSADTANIVESSQTNISAVNQQNVVHAVPQQNVGERSLQQSPQEMLRSRTRARSQLPSFSLIQSGQGGSGIFEEADDSTVPSTPTLFLPKRTDGFAEAVSSPVVRSTTFSFNSNEQPTSSSQSMNIQSSGIDESRNERSNVPMTPLGVVPTSVMTVGHQHESSTSSGSQKIESDDNSQEEQNVPQQVDVSDNDEDNDDLDDQQNDGVIDDNEEAVELIDDAVEIFAPDDINEESSDPSESTTSSSASNNEEEIIEVPDTENTVVDDGVIDLDADDAEDGVISSQEPMQQSTSTYFTHSVSDEKEAQPSSLSTEERVSEKETFDEQTPSTHSTTQDSSVKSEEAERSRPVRLQRSTRGVRPIIRRVIKKPHKEKEEE